MLLVLAFYRSRFCVLRRTSVQGYVGCIGIDACQYLNACPHCRTISCPWQIPFLKTFSSKPHKTDSVGIQNNVVPEPRKKYVSSIHNRVFFVFFGPNTGLFYPYCSAFQCLNTGCYQPACGRQIQRLCRPEPCFCVFLYHFWVLFEDKDKYSFCTSCLRVVSHSPCWIREIQLSELLQLNTSNFVPRKYYSIKC